MWVSRGGCSVAAGVTVVLASRPCRHLDRVRGPGRGDGRGRPGGGAQRSPTGKEVNHFIKMLIIFKYITHVGTYQHHFGVFVMFCF